MQAVCTSHVNHLNTDCVIFWLRRTHILQQRPRHSVPSSETDAFSFFITEWWYFSHHPMEHQHQSSAIASTSTNDNVIWRPMPIAIPSPLHQWQNRSCNGQLNGVFSFDEIQSGITIVIPTGSDKDSVCQLSLEHSWQSSFSSSS